MGEICKLLHGKWVPLNELNWVKQARQKHQALVRNLKKHSSKWQGRDAALHPHSRSDMTNASTWTKSRLKTWDQVVMKHDHLSQKAPPSPHACAVPTCTKLSWTYPAQVLNNSAPPKPTSAFLLAVASKKPKRPPMYPDLAITTLTTTRLRPCSPAGK